jgi:rhomboid family GlyGly-CTERM serine protease
MGLVMLVPAALVFDDRTAVAVLAWQPSLWITEPWRAWSAAWVHLSRLHLGANLAGGVLVMALGAAAAVPMRAVLAWALAWPLTHVGLALVPQLARYGGLSGVLHAGVAVVAVTLLRRRERAERRLGGAIAAVLVLKLLSETPWRGALAHPEGWDIATAPAAHVSGVVVGAGLAWLLVRGDGHAR